MATNFNTYSEALSSVKSVSKSSAYVGLENGFSVRWNENTTDIIDDGYIYFTLLASDGTGYSRVYYFLSGCPSYASLGSDNSRFYFDENDNIVDENEDILFYSDELENDLFSENSKNDPLNALKLLDWFKELLPSDTKVPLSDFETSGLSAWLDENFENGSEWLEENKNLLGIGGVLGFSATGTGANLGTMALASSVGNIATLGYMLYDLGNDLFNGYDYENDPMTKVLDTIGGVAVKTWNWGSETIPSLISKVGDNIGEAVEWGSDAISIPLQYLQTKLNDNVDLYSQDYANSAQVISGAYNTMKTSGTTVTGDIHKTNDRKIPPMGTTSKTPTDNNPYNSSATNTGAVDSQIDVMNELKTALEGQKTTLDSMYNAMNLNYQLLASLLTGSTITGIQSLLSKNNNLLSDDYISDLQSVREQQREILPKENILKDYQNSEYTYEVDSIPKIQRDGLAWQNIHSVVSNGSIADTVGNSVDINKGLIPSLLGVGSLELLREFFITQANNNVMAKAKGQSLEEDDENEEEKNITDLLSMFGLIKTTKDLVLPPELEGIKDILDSISIKTKSEVI